jgi:hypothetical protein
MVDDVGEASGSGICVSQIEPSTDLRNMGNHQFPSRSII